MNKFKQLPVIGQIGVAILAGIVAFALAWYGPYPGLGDKKTKNQEDLGRLQAKQAENAKLRPFEGKLNALETQIASLQLQMERQRRIVPDVKSADDFIREMEQAASSSGIEIRSFEAKPVAAKQYYTEVPFDVELDGPYYAMLNFFDHIAGMERIVNVDNLRMSGIGAKSGSVAKRKYDYAPNESVTVACTAKTFFSKPANAAAEPAAAPEKK